MLSWLLAAVSLAWAQTQPPTPALTDESLDRLVSLPTPATLSTRSFRHLHGFKDTEHLAPVLLPTESRYKVLQSAEEVREALSLDPLFAKLHPLVTAALREELQASPTGLEVLEGMEELPPILFTESDDLLGSYRPALDAIAINWTDARAVFPQAAELDSAGLLEFLAEDADRARRLVREFAPVLAHELVHAKQRRVLGLDPKKLPNGGRYLELEEEAYFLEVKLLVERLESSPAEENAGLHETYLEALLHFVPSLDHYLAAIEDSYVRLRKQVVPLKHGIRAQRAVVKGAKDAPEREAARAGLAQLEKAAEFYQRLRRRMSSEWPSTAVRASLAVAELKLESDPKLAMTLAVHASAVAKAHQLDGAGALPVFASAVRARWKALEKEQADPKAIRRRYLQSVEESCKTADFDCGRLLDEFRKEANR